jgi:hypothetical protein
MQLDSVDSHFLQSNRDEIFKSLISAENHLRKLTGDRSKPGYGACVMKHLAEAEAESEEAVSHALETEGPTSSNGFKIFAEHVRELRKRFQEKSIDPPEGLARLKQLRREFVPLSPQHDVSKCTKCSDADGQLESVRELLEEGGEDDGSGLPFLISKEDDSVRNSSMKPQLKTLGTIYVASFGAKGAELVFDQIDKASGQAANPILYRPSTYLNLGLGIALPLLATHRKLEKYSIPMMVAGAFLLTKSVDYVLEVQGGASPMYVPTRSTCSSSYVVST